MDFNKLTTEQINKSVITDRLKMVAVVTICGIMLFACSNSSNKASVANSKASEIALIKSRWEKAFQDLTKDIEMSSKGIVNVSTLKTYFGTSVVNSFDKSLTSIAAANVISHGSIDFGKVPQIVILGLDRAIAYSCGVDSGWYQNRKTNLPAFGTQPGTLQAKVTAWIQLVSGNWKIEKINTIEGNHVC
jgi:hypothetical protein